MANTIPYVITHGLGDFAAASGIPLLLTRGLFSAEGEPPEPGEPGAGALVGVNRLVGV